MGSCAHSVGPATAELARHRCVLRPAEAQAPPPLHYTSGPTEAVWEELATRKPRAGSSKGQPAIRGACSNRCAPALYGYAFADTLQPLPARPREPVVLERTDFALTSRCAPRIAAAQQGPPLQAIVVLTDGRQVGGDSGIASALSDVGVPVYAVSAGSPAPPDVAIVDVQLPSRQFVGETTIARVQLRGTGMKGKSVEVKLEAAGQTLAKTATFAEPLVTIEYPLKFDAPATHGVTSASHRWGGEVTAANNLPTGGSLPRPTGRRDARLGECIVEFQHCVLSLSRVPWATVDAELLDAPGARGWSAARRVMDRSVVVLGDVTVDAPDIATVDAHVPVGRRPRRASFRRGRNTNVAAVHRQPAPTDLLPFRAGSRPAWAPGRAKCRCFESSPRRVQRTWTR